MPVQKPLPLNEHNPILLASPSAFTQLIGGGICVVLIFVVFTWIVSYQVQQQLDVEIENEDYAILRSELETIRSNDEPTIKAQAFLRQRMNECLADDKITVREYQTMMADRREYIVKERFSNSKKLLRETLSETPKELEVSE